MAIMIVGKAKVFGIPRKLKLVEGIPSGARCRFRFRAMQAAKVFVRIDGYTSVHHIEIAGTIATGAWHLGPALGLNQRN